MKTIYKYVIVVADSQILQLPIGAEILTIQVQKHNICLWAKVDPNLKSEPRTIEMFGTGHKIPEGKRNYLDTFQAANGALVFHVFELLTNKKSKSELDEVDDYLNGDEK